MIDGVGGKMGSPGRRGGAGRGWGGAGVDVDSRKSRKVGSEGWKDGNAGKAEESGMKWCGFSEGNSFILNDVPVSWLGGWGDEVDEVR